MKEILTQGQVDSFVSRLPVIPGVTISEMFRDLIRYSSSIVRAANGAGWFDEKLEKIDEFPPKKTISLAQEVITAYGKSLEVSPE